MQIDPKLYDLLNLSPSDFINLDLRTFSDKLFDLGYKITVTDPFVITVSKFTSEDSQSNKELDPPRQPE